jgi:hypothetical protein
MASELFGPHRQHGQRNQQDDLEEGCEASRAGSKIIDQGELQGYDDRDGCAHEPTVEHLSICELMIVGHVARIDARRSVEAIAPWS